MLKNFLCIKENNVSVCLLSSFYLQVNDTSLRNTTHENAVLVLKSTGENVTLHVTRKLPEPERPPVVHSAVVNEPDLTPPPSEPGMGVKKI